MVPDNVAVERRLGVPPVSEPEATWRSHMGAELCRSLVVMSRGKVGN